ncbi:EamA family transporter, partial [Rhizobium leguminosarum]
PAWRDQPFILAQELCLFSLNFICFYNTAASIPSGLISVIFSLATIYNADNARLFFGDRITGRTLLAAALGAAGLLLLFG